MEGLNVGFEGKRGVINDPSSSASMYSRIKPHQIFCLQTNKQTTIKAGTPAKKNSLKLLESEEK